MRPQLNRSRKPRTYSTRLSRLITVTIALSLSLGMATMPCVTQAIAAHKDRSESKPSKDLALESKTGLDADSFAAINLGRWKDAIASLTREISTHPEFNHEQGWLAFAYLYLGQCDDLTNMSAQAQSIYDAKAAADIKTATTIVSSPPAAATATTTASSPKPADAAADKVSTQPVAPISTKEKPHTEAQVSALIVQVYEAICRNKIAQAAAEMALIPDDMRDDALVNFTMACVCAKQGKSHEALSFSQRCAAQTKNFAWAYRNVGHLAQHALKDYDTADAAYVMALALEPRLNEVRDSLVDIRLIKNDFDGALAVQIEGFKSDPDQANYHYRLAQIYTQQFRYEEALRELEGAINLNQNVAKYYRSRASIERSQARLKRYNDRIGAAIADMQKAVDLSKDKPFELVELASMNQEAGNPNRAADNLMEALKLDPDNTAAHDRLVALLTAEKRYDDLVAEYKRVVGRKPKDAAAQLGLAMALINAGKVDEAVGALKEAANLDPHNPEPHRQMGAIRYKQKDYHNAVVEYTYALNINPSSVPDLVALGYAYASNDDFSQAEAAFVTALALQQLTQPNLSPNNPERINVTRALVLLLLKEQRYSEAAAQMESIYVNSKETVNGPVDHFILARAKALRDLSNVAANDLINAYSQLGPEQQKDNRNLLISTLLDAGKSELALPIIKDALAEAKDNQPANSRPENDSQKEIELVFLSARAMISQGRSKDAQGMIAAIIPANSTAASPSPDDAAKASSVSDNLLTTSEVFLTNNFLEPAENYARRAAEVYPKNYKVYIQLGRIALKQGKPKDAISWARKAMDINQYAPDSFIVVGNADMALGNVKDASANFRKAAELYPGLLEAHQSMLDTLRKLGKTNEAKLEQEQVEQMEKQK